MKKLTSLAFICSLLIGYCSFPAGAMGGPAPKKAETAPSALLLADKVFMIDNFESGSIKSPREWWTFELSKGEAVSNNDYKGGDEEVASEVGNYSMLISGRAKNWYAGGFGTYIGKEGQDLSKYNSFSVDVYGDGPGSGTLKVELADDDNNNWQAEQDPAKSYTFIYDDKFSYEIKIDWNGWKRVTIPFSDFVDENPQIGDDIWNPGQLNGSGGLLQVQFICLGSTDSGNVNANIDNVMLTAK
ncbi:MAG: hypothetical protein ABIH50_06965 [bacterium]